MAHIRIMTWRRVIKEKSILSLKFDSCILFSKRHRFMKGLATVSPLVKGCGERMGLFSHHYKERENIFETSVQI